MIDPDLLAVALDTPPAGPAVYLLIVGDEVVYVGFSVRPAARVKTHRNQYRRQFDRAIFVPVRKARGYRLEQRWIGRLRPKHNLRGNRGRNRWAESWGVPTLTAQDGRRLVLRGLAPDLAYWIDVAAKLEGVAVHDFISRHVGQPVRNEMIARGGDPDALWSAVGGN